MKKKEALANSFSSPRVKKTKKTLSPEVIEQIAESREAEKTKDNTATPTIKAEKKIEQPLVVQQTIESKVQEPIAKTTKQKSTKLTVPKKASNNRTRRTSEEKLSVEREIKTSFDIPENIYDDMRIYLIRQKKSMREYLLELIVKDLAKK